MGANTPEKVEDIEKITKGFIALPFDDLVAKKAAEIYHTLRKQNKMIEFSDIFIAATCLVNDLSILTLNKKHFNRVNGLVIL